MKIRSRLPALLVAALLLCALSSARGAEDKNHVHNHEHQQDKTAEVHEEEVIVPKQRGELNWAHESCDTLTEPETSHFHGLKWKEACYDCVDATQNPHNLVRGDASRCHTCLRPVHGGGGHHQAHLNHGLALQCMKCVPEAESKYLGWACLAYCSHHHIIADVGQARDCAQCLMTDLPKDKWGCHICMEEITENMDARRDCFKCIAEGKADRQCGYCGRVAKASHRAQCYQCMDTGNSTGADCAKKYGIGPFDRSVQFEDWKNGSNIDTNGNRMLRTDPAGAGSQLTIRRFFKGSSSS